MELTQSEQEQKRRTDGMKARQDALDKKRAAEHAAMMTELGKNPCAVCKKPAVTRHSDEVDGKVQPPKFYCAEHRLTRK